jgi:hypothetical protein
VLLTFLWVASLGNAQRLGFAKALLHDPSILTREGYSVNLSEEGFLVTFDKKAINNPHRIASIIVKSDCSLTMLKVEEEDLESYFLRIIGKKEDH